MNRPLLLLIVTVLGYLAPVMAQLNVEGDFQMRWYSDSFSETRDNRNKESYIRYLSRLSGVARATRNITVNTEVSVQVQKDNMSARNLGGTGRMAYGVTQLFAEVTEANFLGMDLARLRAGRQAFGVGNGLSFGESYYYLDKFDGARVDLAYGNFALTVFGAITGQNLSESGLYPEPGSDQLYVTRLSSSVFNQDVMGYYILDKKRGPYNDYQIFGGGVSGGFLKDKLEYFGEFAAQSFNTLPGLPEKGGIGYMAGASYSFPLWVFRSVKMETRYAAYQGDDKSTAKTEIFSPSYPSFFWGDRFGYVNGEAGGNYPYGGRNPEGSRIWYTRIYVIPRALPDLRVQLQYVKLNEYTDNDSYNTFDDEVSLRLYYRLFRETQLQLRYTTSIPNGEDKDVNNSGLLSSSEDRYRYQRFMMEIRVAF